MQQSGPALPRRLNGRAAACDPCRARKLACDHSQPVCKRCKKRGNDINCVYREPALRGGGPRPRTAHKSPTTPSIPLRFEALSHPASPTNEALPPAPGATTGYWGLASHAVVFDEAKQSLSMFSLSQQLPSIPSLSSPSPAASSNRTAKSRVPFRERPAPLREMCLYVLRCLPGQANEIMTFGSSTSDPSELQTWGDIIVDRITTSILGCLDEIRHCGEGGLEAMAEMLCDNTAQPIRDDCETHTEWLEQFTGQRLRWETLGLLCLYLDRVSDMFDAVSYNRLEYAGDKPVPEIVLVCVKYCIEIATSLTEANVLLVDLCRRAASQDSMVHGDGLAVTMANFLGMHVQTNDGMDLYQPTFCSEYKRRLYAHLFISDKLGVSFTGRPPIVSRRFNSTPLPLDISDVDMCDPERRSVALSNLDSHGWSKSGILCSATVMRARTMVATIRDELYEIALDSTARVRREVLLDLYERLETVHQAFPEVLRYKPDDSDAKVSIQYIRIACQLEILQTQFFIRRLIHWHDPRPSDEGNVLDTSFAMLELVLSIWVERDRFADSAMRRNFEWFVMEYGSPAGGVLCLELLRPTFTGNHFKNSSVSRSSIIQNLTLLVGFLDWVKPSAPNSDLCADCKLVIKRVLDHHLNNPAPMPTAAVDPSSQVIGLASDETQLQPSASMNYVEPLDQWMPAEDMPIFNFQLMDTFDWLRNDDLRM
ncbi:hypothetical protein Micbo1qcDRAFT_208372 [Microdochium bolleyi]|uniref:Zn(2)-C6 fungal-type domain-containing protein n=1 Tax=Microdochium bolleyi TaxID=196109 RepID=A0A136IQZ6_9PEZI|nr:hypothetical protein Micbo1qcDRAFT_208372 [Microdochium bolleyi]